jgi:nicotinamide-nucleotide amidase
MSVNGLPGEPRFDQMLRALAESLRIRNWTLAAAESCTGGWIAKCCTDLAGSSAWFERGYVTYSNEAKQQMLGVRLETLQADGAVSRAVARQMVEGARRNAGVNVALSVTGIAGPDGGSADKPVGTVWFGWSVDQRDTMTEFVRFEGDRDAVRRQTVGHALSRLLALLDT